MFAGIEAGGTKFVVAVGTGPEDLNEPARFPTTTPGETMARAIAVIEDASTTPAAIGIASFGPLDLDPSSPTYGHVTSTPKPGWQGADVVGPLQAAFGVPVGFDTDVNGAALGEARWGATVGLDTSVYVTVGTGIGGGGLAGGRLLHGLVHPEMGHLLVRRHPDDTYAGRCPYHGDCLEGLAAGPAITERWGGPASSLTGGDHATAVAIEAHYLGQLVASLTYVLSPRRIVLGGGVMHTEGLLDAVREEAAGQLNGYIRHPEIVEHMDRYVVRPGLGDRAGVLGAVALAADAANGAG